MNHATRTLPANLNRQVREPAVRVSVPAANLVREALRSIPEPVPEPPPWGHRFVPARVRELLANLGWWANPAPQPPSTHLEQTLAVIEKYGWCQSLDTSPTGRLCIRGAQNLLEKTGHTTPHAREKAVAYMQQALHQAGVTMQFFTWNDLPDQHLSAVQALIRRAADLARANGE